MPNVPELHNLDTRDLYFPTDCCNNVYHLLAPQAVIINYRNIMKLIPIVLLSERLLCFTPMKTQCSQVNISIFMIFMIFMIIKR